MYNQQSTNTTHKTLNRATRTSTKTGSELRCSGRVISSCSTSNYIAYAINFLCAPESH